MVPSVRLQMLKVLKMLSVESSKKKRKYTVTCIIEMSVHYLILMNEGSVIQYLFFKLFTSQREGYQLAVQLLTRTRESM